MSRSRGTSFQWLNATQFFGALNDNIFKLLLVFFLIQRYGTEAALRLGALATVLFVLPFLLFATTAGYLADRFSKQRIVVGIKVLELAIMLLAVAAFMAHNVWMICGALFLMATQSALFGPAKYGIIPELTERGDLSRANSLLSAFTYLAIVIGTAGGPFITEWTGHNFVLGASICVVLAVAGLLCSVRIRATPAARTRKRLSLLIVSDVWRTLRRIAPDRYLLLAVLASAYFLLIGAFIQINLLPYGIEVLGLSETRSGYLFIVAAVAIGLGSLLAGKLSGRNVEFGVVPIGAFGMTLTALGLTAGWTSLTAVLCLVFLLGVSAGLFVVPLNAFIQYRAPREHIGEILAASSFLSWVGVLLTALFLQLADTWFGMTARQGFLVIALLTLVLTLVSLRVLPDFLIRFIALIVVRSCYRVRTRGLSHYPVEGPALLVSNHVSYVDALILGVLRPRRIRFIMNREMYETPWLKPLLKLMGVIPISFHDSPKRIIESFRMARRALDDGFVVCIFAEGSITRSGLPRQFKAGFERIVRGTGYPVVPVYLGGLWGSIFSYYHGDVFSRWPMRFPYPVTVLFGEPLPPTATAAEVRQKVVELSCDYFESLKPSREPLGRLFVRTARKNRRRRAVRDSTGRDLTYGRALAAVVALAGCLRRRLAGQEKVGVLLPTTASGALANVALTLLRKVPVNLNYTASPAVMASSVQQCGIQTIITSRAFIEKLGGMELPGKTLFVEDLFAGLSPGQKLAAGLKARFLPARRLDGRRAFHADDLLTIIFSSGSTGDPKGVMLSHHNILSNLEALRMVFRVTGQDDICAVLPFFHSFGYTGTIWFPLLSGFSASYHPRPLDGAGVANLVRKSASTLLLATPTFLAAYLRKADPDDFRTLRMVIVGAEKLKKRTADAFHKKFGVRPYEGYGATELSPVAALNIPDVELDRVFQVGAKEGSVGHPLPGVAMRVMDPDTGEDLPLGEPGLLLVKGPNVMLGYLNRPGETAEVLRDGWYRTGDIAKMDEDGFVTITDRLARFSKIGGEMVPHLAVEEAYHAALGKTGQVLAVTAAPDEKKGERLVVLYTDEAGTPGELHRAITASGLPNLWRPAPDSYRRVETLPLLGSGKLDIRALREMARRESSAGT